MFARIENGEIAEYPILDIRLKFPEMSLPSDLTDDSNLPDGFVFVNDGKLPENDGSKKYTEGQPVFKGGKWFSSYSLTEYSPEEKSIVVEAMSNTVRYTRDEKLRATDWTQGKDIDDSISLLWVDYRQALRDITSQKGFPFSITWPDAPAV